MVATGIWKATPKAKNRVSTKSRYSLMSVITSTPSGAVLVRKANTSGKTTT